MTWKPKLITATAALSAGLLVLAGCQSDTGTINGDDEDGNNESTPEEIPGLPSSAIEDWEGACETLNVDDVQEFFDTDDWRGDSPLDHAVGEGTLSHALSCDGLINWPEFTYPSGREDNPSGQFRVLLIPLDAESHDMEEAHVTDGWLEHIDEERQNDDNFSHDPIEGPWDRGHLVASDADYSDLYDFQFADIDFTVQGAFEIPHDPATRSPDLFESFDEDPADWIHFDFDRESAERFLVEDYLPSVYQNIMDGLER